MKDFSEIVKAEMEKQKMSVCDFSLKMGFSDKYVYDLLKGRNGSRWNSDSILKACEILGIKIQFVTKSA